jgi:hypothetical protein
VYDLRNRPGQLQRDRSFQLRLLKSNCRAVLGGVQVEQEHQALAQLGDAQDRGDSIPDGSSL